MTTHPEAPGAKSRFREIRNVLAAVPDGPVFAIFLPAWLFFFHSFGNSNFGNVKTHSLFHWMDWVYHSNEDDALGLFIPFVVLGLLWWKRDELRQLAARRWWPGLIIVGIALAAHFAGFFLQQNRLSIVGFYLGLWGFAGALWGPRLLKATFFPTCLLVFCIPLTTIADTITFPLRLFATTATTFISQHVLGIKVLRQGTYIFDESGRYSYEVAAACSGIRSLTAVFVLTTIYGFIFFQHSWKRLVVVLLGIPLVVISNVLRLLMIILATEAVSPQAGHYVHDSTWMSLLPYVVAFGGVLLVGRVLREDRNLDIKDAAMPAAALVGTFAIAQWIWAEWQGSSVAQGHTQPTFGIGSLVFVSILSGTGLALLVPSLVSFQKVRLKSWGIAFAAMALITAFTATATDRQRSQRLSPPGVKVIPELVYAVSPTNRILAGTNAVYLPEKVLAYDSEALPLSSVVYDWLPKDTTYGQRRYTNTDGFIIDNIVVLMGTDRTSIHRPELCITGQGFRILSETNGVVRMRDPIPYDLPVRRIHFAGEVLDSKGQKKFANGIFVYWFVSDDEVTADHKHRMSQAMRDFIRTGVIKRWAYVINMAFCKPGDETATYDRIKRFIEASAPEYQLTAGSPRPAQPQSALSVSDR